MNKKNTHSSQLTPHSSLLTPHTSYIIAYSGGIDSHVLLHLMHEYKKTHPHLHLYAVHINHQLNPASSSWASHCQKICDELHIPLSIETISVPFKPGDSLEENARNSRYDILKKYLDEDTVLLTAHNQNDQAETFLLQALRGAGPKGLSAMPCKKKLGKSFLIRPLLSFTREKIEHYAKAHQLSWIEDTSNIDPRFRRNFLRHEIFPALQKMWPTVAENFSRSASLVAIQEKILNEYIQEDFKKIETDDPKKILLKELRAFSPEKQQLLLREWFFRNNMRMLNQKHLKQIQKDVISTNSPTAGFRHKAVEVVVRGEKYLAIQKSLEHEGKKA